MTVIKVVKVNKRKTIFSILGLLVLLILAFSMRNAMRKQEVAPDYQEPEAGNKNFVFEPGVLIDPHLFDEETLREMEISASLEGSSPTVLITHTHISEEYSDGGTVKEVGQALADILAEKYGITVVHDVNTYDIVDGKIQREGAYERMEENVQGILEKYPTISVIIDLHRDYVAGDKKLFHDKDDVPMAHLMLVNGVCTGQNSPWNEYLEENLAFSLQLYEGANINYAGLFRKNYIKPYRYSTHMVPLSLLVEVGFQNNTIEEAVNAMMPLSETLMKVLE